MLATRTLTIKCCLVPAWNLWPGRTFVSKPIGHPCPDRSPELKVLLWLMYKHMPAQEQNWLSGATGQELAWRGVGRSGSQHLLGVKLPAVKRETPAGLPWLDVVHVNVMDQYRPEHRINEQRFPEINRRTTSREYQDAVCMAQAAGLWRLDRRRPHRLLMNRIRY